MKKSILILLLVFIHSFNVLAQENSLPKNIKVGKCYVKSFDINQPWVWKEIDCKLKKKYSQLFSTDANRKELIQYQKKLIKV